MSQIWKLLTSLSVSKELAERHCPAEIGADFNVSAASLDAYISAARRHVEQGRTDLDTPRRDWIIDGNSPFLLQPAKAGGRRRAILMVHGLTDSPFMLRDIASFFQAQGFTVLGMLLPHHGTRPGDLLNCRWQDWLNAHQHLLDLLQEQADEIHLLGFSAGATLSLYQALRHVEIRALYLFSPALRVRWLAGLSGPLAWLGRWSRRLAWFDVQPDSDCFKYESLANRGIWEACKLMRAWQRLEVLKPLKVPVFVAASANDVTISSPAILDWFGTLRGEPRRMLWYSTRQTRTAPHVRVVEARHPEQRIKSSAHTAMLAAPSNPHYGAQGSHYFCTQYYRLDPDKYRRCKDGDVDCRGEMFDETPDCQVLQRLTYNPQFEDMLMEIRHFLDALEAQPGSGGQG